MARRLLAQTLQQSEKIRSDGRKGRNKLLVAPAMAPGFNPTGDIQKEESEGSSDSDLAVGKSSHPRLTDEAIAVALAAQDYEHQEDSPRIIDWDLLVNKRKASAAEES